MRAAYGTASGDSEGSPIDVLASSASALELDEQNLTFRGELRATGYESSAELDTAQGANAATQGTIDAGAALLKGARDAAFSGSGLAGGTPTATPARGGPTAPSTCRAGSSRGPFDLRATAI